MALDWPSTIRDALVQLSDEQDYATLWHAITLWVLQFSSSAHYHSRRPPLGDHRLCFPEDYQYLRIRLAPDGLSLCVEMKGFRIPDAILIAITWEAPNKIPGAIPPIPRRPGLSECFYRIHATGPYISCCELSPGVPHNDNGVHHLFESAGISIVFECFEKALNFLGYNFKGGFDEEDVTAVEDFLSSRASLKKGPSELKTHSIGRRGDGIPNAPHVTQTKSEATRKPSDIEPSVSIHMFCAAQPRY